jgi:Family of unknown function (DUF6152)
MLKRFYAFLVIGLLGSTLLQAHHSPASHYLIKDLISVEGVVTEFRLTNPHARIYFDVTTPEGEVQHWFAEGNSSSILKRRGWTKDSLKPGDAIKISGYPARDGGHSLDWKLIELADGTQLRGGNTVGIEQDLLLADIDKKRNVETSQPPVAATTWKLDPLSYSIGNFSTFAEIVAIGIKEMALSEALPAAEMDRLEPEVRSIAAEHQVSIYREADFLVTNLFPASATAGKDVLIIYRGDTLEKYLALKKRKADLEAAGKYGEEAQLEMAWAIGKLLSYPDERIKQLLSK